MTRQKIDALEAFEFYERRSEGLGGQFRDHLGFAFGRIQTKPDLYPLVYRDLRRRLVERFPYAVLYRIYPGLVYVVAIMHVRQSPAKWLRRAIDEDSR